MFSFFPLLFAATRQTFERAECCCCRSSAIVHGFVAMLASFPKLGYARSSAWEKGLGASSNTTWPCHSSGYKWFSLTPSRKRKEKQCLPSDRKSDERLLADAEKDLPMSARLPLGFADSPCQWPSLASCRVQRLVCL